jgi:hypothetical protein
MGAQCAASRVWAGLAAGWVVRGVWSMGKRERKSRGTFKEETHVFMANVNIKKRPPKEKRPRSGSVLIFWIHNRP